MVMALAIFCFVIDHFIDDLHLTDGIVTLEIGRVIVGIPQTELNAQRTGSVGLGVALVAQGHLPDLERLSPAGQNIVWMTLFH